MNFNFDDIARQLFGPQADEYKKMLERLSPAEIQKLKQDFEKTPFEYRQRLANEVKSKLNGVSGSNAVNNSSFPGIPGITKVRY